MKNRHFGLFCIIFAAALPNAIAQNSLSPYKVKTRIWLTDEVPDECRYMHEGWTELRSQKLLTPTTRITVCVDPHQSYCSSPSLPAGEICFSTPSIDYYLTFRTGVFKRYTCRFTNAANITRSTTHRGSQPGSEPYGPLTTSATLQLDDCRIDPDCIGNEFIDSARRERLFSTGTSQAGAGCHCLPLLVSLDHNAHIKGLKKMPIPMQGGAFRQISWPITDGTFGFLIVDLNQNKHVDDSSELITRDFFFGDPTRLKSPFRALSMFDSLAFGGNEDGQLSNLDLVWDSLSVWFDADNNAVSNSDELKSLDQLKIVSLEYAPKRHNQRPVSPHLSSLVATGKIQKECLLPFVRIYSARLPFLD